jgi:hypothetical protein
VGRTQISTAYYIMDLDKGIATTMAEHKPSPAQVAACKWMTNADLQVYSQEFQRTGFQGGLNYYRIDGVFSPDSGLNAYSGKTIDVPACYIGGSSEWAVYQSPGSFERMHTLDAFIAATAQVHKLTSATRNQTDFELSVDAIVNPWSIT